MDFSVHRHPVYDHVNVKETMTKRNESQTGDLVKGAKGNISVGGYKKAVVEGDCEDERI